MNPNKYIEEAIEQLRCKCGDDDGKRCRKVETGIDDVQDAFTEALTSFKEDVVALARQLRSNYDEDLFPPP